MTMSRRRNSSTPVPAHPWGQWISGHPIAAHWYNRRFAGWTTPPTEQQVLHAAQDHPQIHLALRQGPFAPKAPQMTGGYVPPAPHNQNAYAPPHVGNYPIRDVAAGQARYANQPVLNEIAAQENAAQNQYQQQRAAGNDIYQRLENKLDSIPSIGYQGIANQLNENLQPYVIQGAGQQFGATPTNEAAASQGAFNAVGQGAQEALAFNKQLSQQDMASVNQQAAVDWQQRQANYLENYRDLIAQLQARRADTIAAEPNQILNQLPTLQSNRFQQGMARSQLGLDYQRAFNDANTQQALLGIINDRNGGGRSYGPHTATSPPGRPGAPKTAMPGATGSTSAAEGNTYGHDYGQGSGKSSGYRRREKAPPINYGSTSAAEGDTYTSSKEGRRIAHLQHEVDALQRRKERLLTGGLPQPTPSPGPMPGPLPAPPPTAAQKQRRRVKAINQDIRRIRRQIHNIKRRRH